MGRLQIHRYSWEFIATPQIIVFTYNIAASQSIVFTQCIVAITVKPLKITFILQPAYNDVKIGPTRTHGNRLFVI